MSNKREPYLWKPDLVHRVQARLDAGDTPAAAARSCGLKGKAVHNAIQQGRLEYTPRSPRRNKTLADAEAAVVSSENPA